MKKKNRFDLVEIIAIVITLSGLFLVIDWIFGIGIQKSIITAHITMKLPTALSFVLSGLSIFLINKNKKGSYTSLIILPLITSLLLLIMIGFLISDLSGIKTPVSKMLFIENVGPAETPFLGSPAVVTVFDFILIAIANMLIVFNASNMNKFLLISGSIIFFTGLIAVIGYTLNIPFLYYNFQEFTNPIALPTAILFSLYGVGFMQLSKK